MNKLFAELQRRNVFRVAGVYAVVGWLLIQVAVAVLPTFGAPTWIAQTFIALIFLGFPIALIFAWAFEMTPEGMKRTTAVPEGESISGKTGKRLDLVLAGMAALLVVVIIGDRLMPSGQSKGAASEDFSIAVLPFADMSPEKDQEYFADGISEELLNVLAQVPNLEVAGRTSSFAFKGQNRDLREIGELLNVAHVLEGSVRKSGNKVRVTAQLIRADNGFHIWSDTYDGDLTDIFAVQDEIANAILAELKPKLMGQIAPVAAHRTDVSAYDFYLIAQQKAAGNTIDAYKEAATALDRALEIDPDFVPALAWRAYYELMMSDGDGAAGDTPIEQARVKANELINRALKLDRESADALFAKAGLLSMAPKADERDQAGAFYQRALELKPNFALARNDYGYWLTDQKRPADAMKQYEIALMHDPAQGDVNTNLIAYYLRTGENEKALAAAKRWSAIAPEHAGPIGFEAAILGNQGELAAASSRLQDALKLAPDDPRLHRDIGDLLLNLGEFQKATEYDDAFVVVRALVFLGQKEKAVAQAGEALSKRPDFATLQRQYVGVLYYAGKLDEIAAFYDETWGNPAALKQAFVTPPYFTVAPALKKAGHKDAAQIAADWRAAVVLQRSNGMNNTDLDETEAALNMLEGNSGTAMDFLEKTFAKGNRDIYLFINPAYASLRETPRFKALETKLLKAINDERAKLGLKPITAPKP